MPRRWRRSRGRRSSGRRVTRALLPTAVVALVAALVVGALADVGRASGPDRRTVDLGFGALASELVVASNASGASLRALLVDAPTLSRLALFSTLDGLDADVDSQDRSLEAVASPSPAEGAGASCLAAFAGRAAGIGVVRQALQGVLGGPSGTTPVEPDAALALLESARSTLLEADASWTSCRDRLRRAPGRTRLASSQWVTPQASWSSDALGRLLAAMEQAPALAPQPALAIGALSTEPASLVAAGATILPPTSETEIHAVVDNQGNVDEPAVQVQVTLVPGAAGGKASTETAIVALGAGRSVAVVLGPFAVRPGTAYTLEVSAAPPAGPGAVSTSLPVQVASVPTTTTTGSG